MDKELFELCKEVYERTRWDRYTLENGKEQYIDKCWWSYNSIPADHPVQRYKLMPEQFIAPLYTSDYLLEKLPDYPIGTKASDANYYSKLIVCKVAQKYEAYYLNYVTQMHAGHSLADTPLKALLKLTVALDDAEELSK